jgi:hypothetical protein
MPQETVRRQFHRYQAPPIMLPAPAGGTKAAPYRRRTGWRAKGSEIMLPFEHANRLMHGLHVERLRYVKRPLA